jgi:SAM-dependent methyltransferase
MMLSRFNDALLWVSRHQLYRGRIDVDPGVVKVNLGSGLCVAPDWINLDASMNALAARLPLGLKRLAYRASGSRFQYSEDEYVAALSRHRFIFCDVRGGLPLRDATVDFLYASHLLEHLERREAVDLLAECKRVLKPQGLLRLVVPDLAYFLDMYEAGDKRDAISGIFAADVPGSLSSHRYMYDEELLSQALREAGFNGAARCRFRQGGMPDLHLLDNREAESLHVEVVK